jgi:hypothetical protein
MATNLGHDDVTVTLDELFANNSVAQLLPQDELLKHWRMVSSGSAKNINARGAFYMLQSRQPNNIRQKAFGTSPGAQFPEPTKSKYLTMNLAAVVDEATLQWDGNVDDQNSAELKQKPAKSLDYVETELEGIYASYARAHARQLWSDGTNELARVSAINAGTFTVTCNNAGNLFNVQLLEEGMLIEIRDSTGATVRGYFQIASVYRPTKTFIIDSNYVHDNTDAAAALAGLGIVNGDRIYPKNGYTQGWKGVDYLIATSGAFQSLADRTIHDHLTGVSIDASARALSAALMRRLRSARRNRRYGIKSKGKFYASSQIDAYEATAFATQKYGQTTSASTWATRKTSSSSTVKRSSGITTSPRTKCTKRPVGHRPLRAPRVQTAQEIRQLHSDGSRRRPTLRQREHLPQRGRSTRMRSAGGCRWCSDQSVYGWSRPRRRLTAWDLGCGMFPPVACRTLGSQVRSDKWHLHQ